MSTFAVLAAFATLAALPLPWPLRLLGSLGAAFTMVRAFILVHDRHHGAAFTESRVAKIVLDAYGLLMLTPPRLWRSTHNSHHAHTARTDGDQRGTYTLFTTEQWRNASKRQRFAYRAEHHPLTLLFGYVTVFLVNFGFWPVLSRPRASWDSLASLAVHVGVGTLAWVLGGPQVFAFAFLIPFFVAGASGAILFYVQHYFEECYVPDEATWTHTDAALGGSSHVAFGPVGSWFTGNIGLHHVHHLNPKIPFYRLPEALAAVPALQASRPIKLGPRTIVRCLRLKLWDADSGRLVAYADA
ncbi:MAG: fatty acid desaturase [Planctomycetota bacterium]